MDCAAARWSALCTHMQSGNLSVRGQLKMPKLDATRAWTAPGAAALLLMSLMLLGWPSSAATPVAAQTALPAAPAGWPSTLQLGSADGPGGAAALRARAPYKFRYQYLSGGANTGNG